MRIVAGEQHPDVAADAGHAEQAGAAVEHVLDIGEAVSLAREIEDHAGIEAAAARRHDQPIQRAEAGGRRDAASAVQRAQAGAGAEMGDDDATARQAWANCCARQPAMYS